MFKTPLREVTNHVSALQTLNVITDHLVTFDKADLENTTGLVGILTYTR